MNEVNKHIADVNVYPQCNSFDPETHKPTALLQQRINQFDKELGFNSWNPRTLLDIGAGKGYFMHHWPSVQRSEAIEFLENIIVPSNCTLHKKKFLETVSLRTADVVLALRVCHNIFMETYSNYYLIKIAMICKDRFLWESIEDLNSTTLSGIKAPLDKAKNEYHKRGLLASKEEFWNMANLFFDVEKQFTSPCKYEVVSFRRKLPPLKEYNGVIQNRREGDKWIKFHCEERVMEYITCCQLLGKTDHILSVLVKNGSYVGLEMKHLDDKETVEDKKNKCKVLFADLCAYLLPIGYLPVDIVPQNVINDIPIDIAICQSVNLTFCKDVFRNQLLKNDIILHHQQLQ